MPAPATGLLPKDLHVHRTDETRIVVRLDQAELKKLLITAVIEQANRQHALARTIRSSDPAISAEVRFEQVQGCGHVGFETVARITLTVDHTFVQAGDPVREDEEPATLDTDRHVREDARG